MAVDPARKVHIDWQSVFGIQSMHILGDRCNFQAFRSLAHDVFQLDLSARGGVLLQLPDGFIVPRVSI